LVIIIPAVASMLLLNLHRTETHGNKVYSYSRDGGSNGTNGSPGTRPSTYLTGGKTLVLKKLLLIHLEN
jgi:hypothetical protein